MDLLPTFTYAADKRAIDRRTVRHMIKIRTVYVLISLYGLTK